MNPRGSDSDGRWQVDNTMNPFYNDNGQTVHPAGNNNTYVIKVGNMDSDWTAKVNIDFIKVHEASNFVSKGLPGCSEINHGDILGDITIYNAEQTGLHIYSYKAAYVFEDRIEAE